MRGRKRGQSHKRASHRCIYLIGKLEHLIFCACRDDSSAEIYVRALCHVDKLGGFTDAYVLCGKRFVRLCRRLCFILAHCGLHVLGDIDKHRTRSARHRYGKGFADGIGKRFDRADEVVMLGYRQCYTGDVDLLEAVGTYLTYRHVSAYGDHRYGIEVCRCYTGDQIRCARTGCRYDHACFACCACISVGGVCGTLFMCGQDVVYTVTVFVQAVINVQDLTARITENRVTSLLYKRVYKYVCT